MKVYKHCGTFVLLTVCTFFLQIHAIDLCGNSWFNYKDDKCYKIYNDKLYTFEDANYFCSEISEYDHTSLAIIRSKEEQEFLVNYVFKTEKKVDNFWIGAKHHNDTFHWVDNSTLGYTNWLKATKNKTDTCVQVQAEEDWTGKWLDVPCTVKSLAVCQKIRWTRPRLKKAYETAFEQQQGSLAEGNKAIQAQTEIISNANKTIEQAYQTISQQKHKIDEANQKITKHQNAIDKTNKAFEKFAQQISDSAKVLNILLFKGCSFRELVEANFSGSICSSDGICTLYDDKFYSFEMKFVANQDSQTIHVYRLFDLVHALNDNIDEDGCKYVKCPLVKGQEYSFIVDKYQTVYQMPYTTLNEFQITLTGDKGTLACAYMKVDVRIN